MRNNADRTVSVIEDNLRGRKINVPSASAAPSFDASKLTGDDKSAYDWAKKNPNDKRSKEIMTRLGG